MGKIVWETTPRGFARGYFTDRHSHSCSIQTSSIATESCIWLGRDIEGPDANDGNGIRARMHIAQELAGELALILLRFHYTGTLSED